MSLLSDRWMHFPQGDFCVRSNGPAIFLVALAILVIVWAGCPVAFLNKVLQIHDGQPSVRLDTKAEVEHTRTSSAVDEVNPRCERRKVKTRP